MSRRTRRSRPPCSAACTDQNSSRSLLGIRAPSQRRPAWVRTCIVRRSKARRGRTRSRSRRSERGCSWCLGSWRRSTSSRRCTQRQRPRCPAGCRTCSAPCCCTSRPDRTRRRRRRSWWSRTEPRSTASPPGNRGGRCCTYTDRLRRSRSARSCFRRSRSSCSCRDVRIHWRRRRRSFRRQGCSSRWRT